DVVLDPIGREAHRGTRPLSLTQREFAVLECFMRNVGVTLTRATIAEQVWRDTPIDVDSTNVIDVYVAYLRKKLDSDGDAPLLHTVRGLGYVLKPPPAQKPKRR
ncbi:MAG: winged helix-turn-helix domain-containing protein, partial [Gemmatimonadales bacterium]